MLEWQNESSLFTVRIQGKQWYWVYKYNSDTNYRLNNVYINVGNNNWMKMNATQSNTTFSYNDAIMGFVFDYEFKQLHKANLKKYSVLGQQLNPYSLFTSAGKYTTPTLNTELNLSVLKNYKLLKFSNNAKSTIAARNLLYKVAAQYDFRTKNTIKVFDLKTLALKNFFNQTNLFNANVGLTTQTDYTDLLLRTVNAATEVDSTMFLNDERHIKYYSRYNRNTYFNLTTTGNLFNLTTDKHYTHFFETDRLDEFSESSENLRAKSSKFPVRLVRGIINKHNAQLLRANSTLSKNILFNYKINNTDATAKISQTEQFWGFRQKRYRKLRSFSFPQHPKYNNITYTYLNNFLNDKSAQTYQLYTAIKNNRYKNELVPVTLARRLLRTKRTLVLPAHINITLITNSYDVVHSWFVPGLGLKIDCVPGRSTHHTLYIDNVGFYYGQCAEICGRYHHHMPIRVCALPYEHFMLWWQTKGLPRMYRSKAFLQNRTALLTKFKY